MQHDIEKTCKSITIEKLQDDVEKLQGELRRLEVQVATLSNIDIGKTISAVEAGEQPHPATGELQRCKKCKYIRLPHKSNAHYTCALRNAIIETTWTCGH